MPYVYTNFTIFNEFVCPYNHQSNRVNFFGLLSADEGLDEAASALIYPQK